jgi:coenzyme F420-reducing hydrogenase gamma subunit
MPGRNIDAVHPDGRLKLAAFKFTSCDGCQLQILNLEDDLLQLAETVEIDFFLEARRRQGTPPYDIGLVEGSISTPEEEDRIRQIRRQCKTLITIGACATSGGIQALRNWDDLENFNRCVYPRPADVASLVTSTPIASHVFVDYELRGCPINERDLLELVSAALAGRRPNISTHSVCVECKRSGHPCVLVSQGKPCLGPVTQVGCGGALCPDHNRACYGCFGPMEQPNLRSLGRWFTHQLGFDARDMKRMLRTFNGYLEPFKQASDHYEQEERQQRSG